MTTPELIEKARKQGYKFLFLSDVEAVFFKENPPLLMQRPELYYASCTTDATLFLHLLGEVLARRLPVRWDGEQ